MKNSKRKPKPVKKPAKPKQEARKMSKHTHKAEEEHDAKAPYESGDLHKEFPQAHEDFNRSAVHLSDRVRNALERSKKAGANPQDLKRIKALSEKVNALLEEIDEIAAKDAKPKKDEE